MTLSTQDMLRSIPKVDRLLKLPEIVGFLTRYPRPEVLAAIRTTLEVYRRSVAEGCNSSPETDGKIVEMITAELERRSSSSLRQVINGTGVVLHTNLGRSPLAEQAVEAIRKVASGYSNLEYNLENGERGTRYSHVEGLVCELTGAEAALVVNNNAAAVLLALS
ncbi:MAG: L-seryl-tRNA(Sec) selenium transferase, partial [Deltaproteobacteria bacterium]